MTGALKADLSGQTALVTGASSGLGRQFAVTLGAAGADVIVAARRAEKLAETVALVTAAGGTARAVEMDVSDGASIDAVFADIGAVDILVNNAGVALTKKVLDWTEEDWDYVMNTNLRGAWMVASAAAKALVGAGKGGSIINIASIAGERVGKGIMPYTVSKAGVVQLTKAMALELAVNNIRVNAIAPGYIITDINRDYLAGDFGEKMKRGIPQRRFGEPQDLDGPLLLLASDASRFMTGSVISVDGGQLVGSM